MTDAEILKSVSVEMPPMPKQCIESVEKQLLASQCDNCHTFVRNWREARLCDAVAIANLGTAIHTIAILRWCGCDDCLAVAGELCGNCGAGLGKSPLSVSAMHKLSQSQAFERDRIQNERLRLWFLEALQKLATPEQYREILVFELRIDWSEVDGREDFEQLQFDALLHERIQFVAEKFIQLRWGGSR